MMLFPNQHALIPMLQKLCGLIVGWISKIKEHANLSPRRAKWLSGDHPSVIHVATPLMEMNSEQMQHDQRLKEMISLVGELHLQQILKQVRSEGFCVESLVIFRDGHLKPSETITAIEHWAVGVGLKVSFNHAYELCVFERM